MGAGGAERVMAQLASAWAGRGDTVALITFTGPQPPPFYELHSGVVLRALDLERPSRSWLAAAAQNWRRLLLLRRALRDLAPEVVISFGEHTNVLCLLSAWGLRIPVVVSERIDIIAYRVPALWRFLRICTYPHAFRIVVQTRRAFTDLPRNWRRKAVVIPNPVAPPRTSEGSSPLPRPLAVAIGRLVPQKGFDLLLQAFAALPPSANSWRLWIYGEGEQRASLEHLRRTLGLEDRVAFPGVCAHIGNALAQADLFVLSSRFEGFPNALAEAMAAGVACIATDCPSGPGELVQDRLNGRLVPCADISALSKAMSQLMSNPADRRILGECARAVALKFSLPTILGLWDRILLPQR